MTDPEVPKSIEEKQPFTIQLRPDGIIVTKLHNFRRSTVEAWMEYVRARDGKLRPPVRMLYDFRESGLPSKFLLDAIGPFMDELTIPEDTRNAYLFPIGPYQYFSRSFMSRMPSHVGAVKGFTDLKSAAKWLLEE